MLKLMSLVLTAVVSVSALANDGGMAYIDVKGINPAEKAGDGTQIKFYGKDAANFMRLLPGYSSVLYAMVRPEVADKLQANERGVALVSDGWTLNINCKAGKVEFPEDQGHGSEEFYKKAEFVSEMPTCEVSLSRNSNPEFKYDQFGDGWSMEPKDYEGQMCSQ